MYLDFGGKILQPQWPEGPAGQFFQTAMEIHALCRSSVEMNLRTGIVKRLEHRQPHHMIQMEMAEEQMDFLLSASAGNRRSQIRQAAPGIKHCQLPTAFH